MGLAGFPMTDAPPAVSPRALAVCCFDNTDGAVVATLKEQATFDAVHGFSFFAGGKTLHHTAMTNRKTMTVLSVLLISGMWASANR